MILILSKFCVKLIEKFCFKELWVELHSVGRHPGHGELEERVINKWKPQFMKGEWEELHIGGKYIELDTTDFSTIDYEKLFDEINKNMKYSISIKTESKDIKKILDFYTDFWKQEYNLDSILGEEAFNNEKFIFFSVNIGEEFIGSGMFERISEEQLELRSIAIKKEFRGKQYGKILVEYMEEYAKKNSIDSIITLAINQAKGFYERLGYRKVESWSDKVVKILEFLDKSGNPTTPMKKDI